MPQLSADTAEETFLLMIALVMAAHVAPDSLDSWRTRCEVGEERE